jgi:hypothetical protein
VRGDIVQRITVCTLIGLVIQHYFILGIAFRVLDTSIGITFTFFVTCLTRVRSGAVLLGQRLAGQVHSDVAAKQLVHVGPCAANKAYNLCLDYFTMN